MAVHCDRGRILKKCHDSRHLHQLRTKIVDDLIDGQSPLSAWLCLTEEKSLAACGGVSHRNLEVWIRLQNVGDSLLPLLHGFERNILPGHRHTKDESAILARNKSSGHHPEQIQSAYEQQDCDDHRREAMTHDFAQCEVVGG